MRGRHGGWYTDAELRELVEFARERGVTVVPEIDMPGHMMAALAAYPHLSCRGKTEKDTPFVVAAEWGVHEDVLCIGCEATWVCVCVCVYVYVCMCVCMCVCM